MRLLRKVKDVHDRTVHQYARHLHRNKEEQEKERKKSLN